MIKYPTKFRYRDLTVKHKAGLEPLPGFSLLESKMIRALRNLPDTRVKKDWCVRKTAKYAIILRGLKVVNEDSGDVRISIWTERIEL